VNDKDTHALDLLRSKKFVENDLSENIRWYSQKTNYVYGEPVCTIPEYQQKGLGKAVVLEALKRGRSLGTEKAYVISDSSFYKSLGFEQHSQYTFYWHDI